LVRDAASELLPFTQIGGLTLGARAVALCRVSAATAMASTIVDVTLELIAKVGYLGLGLLCLLHLMPALPLVLPLTISLLGTGIAAAIFVVMQRRGFALFDRFVRGLEPNLVNRAASGALTLHVTVADMYRRKAGLWAGFLLHLICWVASALEVWLALRIAGLALDLGAVLVIESLLYGIRTFAFAVPSAIGIQEATYVLVGANFGLTPELALAISLLKRARDLIIGVPVLIIWQAIEGGRFWRGRMQRRSN